MQTDTPNHVFAPIDPQQRDAILGDVDPKPEPGVDRVGRRLADREVDAAVAERLGA